MLEIKPQVGDGFELLGIHAEIAATLAALGYANIRGQRVSVRRERMETKRGKPRR